MTNHLDDPRRKGRMAISSTSSRRKVIHPLCMRVYERICLTRVFMLSKTDEAGLDEFQRPYIPLRYAYLSGSTCVYMKSESLIP